MPPQSSIVSAPRRSLETWTGLALSATLLLSLIVFIPSSSIPFIATKNFVLAAGALVTLALYILARLARGSAIFPPLLLVGALWLPAIAYTLSAAFSGVPFLSAFWGVGLEPDTLGFMLVASALGTLAAFSLRRVEQYRTFLTIGAWTFGGIVALQILTLVVGQIIPNTISPGFSLLGSFQDLASFVGLGVIGVLLSIRFLELQQRSLRALVAAGVAALALLAVANSALVWVLVSLASLGLFVEAVMRRRTDSTDTDLDGALVVSESSAGTDSGSHSLVMPLVTLAASLFFLVGGTLGGALANALHVNVLSVRPSWQSTFTVAQKVYPTAPFFGTGPGTFGTDWLKYRDAALNSTVFWNIDFASGIGFIPTSLVTTGLIGVLAWLAFFALILVFGLRALILKTPEDSFVRYVSILSFVATLYLFVTAFFGLPNTVILALGFVFAGLFASTLRFAQGASQWGIVFARSPRIGFLIVFALTLLLLGSVAAAYTLVEHGIATVQLTKGTSALASGDLATADAAARSSLAFSPSAQAYQLQANVATTYLRQIASSSTMPVAQAQQAFQTTLSSGISAALTATRLDPANYQNWVVLGNLYAQAVPLQVTGSYESAKTAYQKAAALSPTNPQIPYILAQLDIAHKDNKAAEADLAAAIALKQDYTAAIFLLSQLEVQDGNIKDALASALAAAYFTPNDPNILFEIGVLRSAEGDYAGAIQALEGAVAANAQFANARYFLAAVYAKQGDLSNAMKHLQVVADLSPDNAKAVASQLETLKAGKNPFPANLLGGATTAVK